ncbi:phage tail protein [Clostridium gasigenes]|uniref:phage tail spike protein n=1 Tax=Clostridium gasigenes TaxID=94869 RepID=UPI001C0D9471|nr:phage tail protein [Clostridium gasigenes]
MIKIVHLYKAINKNYEYNGDFNLDTIISSLEFDGGIKNVHDIKIEIEYDEENIWGNIDRYDVLKLDTPILKEQLYRIYRISTSDIGLTIFARPLFYDTEKTLIIDKRNVNANGQEVITKAFEGTEYTGHSNITTRANCNWIKKNIVNSLLGKDDYSFVSNYGGELWIDNYNVTINDKIGGDYGVQCSYGTNVKSIEKDVDTDSVYTRIVPYAHNNLMLLETYVDSPLINNYPIVQELPVSMDDIKVKEKPEDEEGFVTEELARAEMKRRCLEMFSIDNIDKPKSNFKVGIESLEGTIEYNDFTNLVNIGIGDTVRIYYKPLNIDLNVRCLNIKCEYNFVKKVWEYTEVELGDAIENFYDKFNNTSNNATNSKDKLDNILTDGNIRAELLKGFISAQNASIRASRDIAKKLDYRAFLLEDEDHTSPNYGAMIGASNAIAVTKKRTLDKKDWDFEDLDNSVCITSEGVRGAMLYGKTIIGDNLYLENANGYFSIDNKGIRIKGVNFKIEGSDGITEDINSKFQVTNDSITAGVTDSKGYTNTQVAILKDSITSGVTDSKNHTDAQVVILSDSIATKVTAGEVKSFVEQTPTSLNIGFNKISNRFQFSDAGLKLLNDLGQVSMEADANGDFSFSGRLQPKDHIIKLFGDDCRIDGDGGYIRIQCNRNCYTNVTPGGLDLYNYSNKTSFRYTPEGHFELIGNRDTGILKMLQGGGGDIQARNSFDNAYSRLQASAFVVSSKVEFKDNIEVPKDINFIKILMETEIKKYNLKAEVDLINKMPTVILPDGTNPIKADIKLGLIINDLTEPNKALINPTNTEGADLYSMVSILWKINQEQELRIQKLEENKMEGVK